MPYTEGKASGLTEFLSNTLLRVLVDQSNEHRNVISGVPQGSVLDR